MDAVRREERLDASLWNALLGAWRQYCDQRAIDSLIPSLYRALHQMDLPAGTEGRYFTGPPITQRPHGFGTVYRPYSQGRMQQHVQRCAMANGPDEPDARTVAERHRGALDRKMVWATWNERDSSKCPFDGFASRQEVISVLALPHLSVREVALIRYCVPESHPLYIPLLPDAISMVQKAPSWHAYFLPVPASANFGRTRPMSCSHRTIGVPECIHQSLEAFTDLDDLQIDEVFLLS